MQEKHHRGEENGRREVLGERGPRERKRGENGGRKGVEKRWKREKKRIEKEIEKEVKRETESGRYNRRAGGRGRTPLSSFELTFGLSMFSVCVCTCVCVCVCVCGFSLCVFVCVSMDAGKHLGMAGAPPQAFSIRPSPSGGPERTPFEKPCHFILTGLPQGMAGY